MDRRTFTQATAGAAALAALPLPALSAGDPRAEDLLSDLRRRIEALFEAVWIHPGITVVGLEVLDQATYAVGWGDGAGPKEACEFMFQSFATNVANWQAELGAVQARGRCLPPDVCRGLALAWRSPPAITPLGDPRAGRFQLRCRPIVQCFPPPRPAESELDAVLREILKLRDNPGRVHLTYLPGA